MIKIKFYSLILFFVVILSLFVVYPFSDVSNDFLANDLDSIANLSKDSKLLIEFFNELNVDATVIGFQKYYLVTFCDMPVIDLSLGYGFENFFNIFQEKTLSQVIEELNKKQIRYLIEPRINTSNEYLFFNNCRQIFGTFDDLLNSNFIKLIKTFDKYYVYLILTAEEYSQYLEEIRDLFYFHESELIISDEDQSDLYQSSNPKIIPSNVFYPVINGDNALEVILEPYSSEKNEGIKYSFSSHNVSSYDFLSFYFYGNNSGVSIDVRTYSMDWSNQFVFSFTDSWTGYARILIPLKDFEILVGTPNWVNIDAVAFFFGSEIRNQYAFYIDCVSFGNGVDEHYVIPFEKISTMP